MRKAASSSFAAHPLIVAVLPECVDLFQIMLDPREALGALWRNNQHPSLPLEVKQLFSLFLVPLGSAAHGVAEGGPAAVGKIDQRLYSLCLFVVAALPRQDHRHPVASHLKCPLKRNGVRRAAVHDRTIPKIKGGKEQRHCTAGLQKQKVIVMAGNRQIDRLAGL